jgi:hypothetical protein
MPTHSHMHTRQLPGAIKVVNMLLNHKGTALLINCSDKVRVRVRVCVRVCVAQLGAAGHQQTCAPC